MRGTALISNQSLKGLERAILVAGSATLAIIVFLLISTGFSQFQHNESKAKYDLTQQQISTLTTTLERAKKINRQPSNAKELGVVQVAMNQFAKKNNCQLLEMSSNSDAVAFLTRYQKGADDRGWKQLPIDCQISGSLSNVMTMIRDFTSMSIPIEIQSLDLTPIEKDKRGNDRVSAKVTFQLIKQEVAL